MKLVFYKVNQNSDAVEIFRILHHSRDFGKYIDAKETHDRT